MILKETTYFLLPFNSDFIARLDWWPLVSISSCQRNLMKTYHNEANTSGITKLHQKIFWSFSNKVVKFRKIAILQPSFSNKLFLKLNLSKNDFSKSCCPKLIFFNEFFFRKDLDNFWHRKMTLKVRFLQFCESIFFVQKSPKNFLMQFLWFH